MSNDLIVNDSVVVGIQGNAVSSEIPTDGYVLTWVDGYSEQQPKPIQSGGLRTEYFTSNGTWTCPAGVNSVLVIAAGGGSGGVQGIAASFSNSVAGGKSSLELIKLLTVISGNIYSVIIGAGGNGGIGERTTQSGEISTAIQPTAGQSTQFKYNSTLLFSVKGAPAFVSTNFYINTYNNGSNGNTISSVDGGPGGEAGPQGDGGNGGDGNTSISGAAAIGGNGSNASDNSGAGGSCGYTNGSLYDCTGGSGGNGGSGYLYIVF